MGTNDLTGEVIGAAIEVHKELGESMGPCGPLEVRGRTKRRGDKATRRDRVKATPVK
ncbi:MAG: hypothetical protein ACERKR_12105 [Deltaproteobacteria bacterium]|jgi:hypothetical protein